VIFYRPYLSVVLVIISIPFEGVIDFQFIAICLERVRAAGFRYWTIFNLEDITIYPLEAILAVSVLVCIYKSILGRDNCFRNMKLVYCEGDCALARAYCDLLSNYKSYK
jgi:hypothetical protein